MADATHRNSSVTDRVADVASVAKDRASEAASSAKDTVQEKAGEVAEKARSRAEEARERVGGKVREEVDRRSSEAGEQVTAMADALRKAADQLEQDGKDAPAKVARQAAERLQGVGGYLTLADAQQIMSDVERYARRQPWLVAAAGALVGIAAARFLKASRPAHEPTVPTVPSSSVPGASYAPAAPASPADVRYPG